MSHADAVMMAAAIKDAGFGIAASISFTGLALIIALLSRISRREPPVE